VAAKAGSNPMLLKPLASAYALVLRADLVRLSKGKNSGAQCSDFGRK